MEADALHDLTAAYALNALEPEDARRYEAHLARCKRCHDELAELAETASALAYATEASAPPPELRARILEQARAERPNVEPLRPRWLRPVVAAAAVAACAAIGLGLWAVSLSGKLDRRETELANQQRVAQILAAPGSHKISFSRGTLVVAPDGRGALVLNKLADPGSDHVYEAWVADGGTPQPAGLFAGGTTVTVPLDKPVGDGATVMVTQEQAGGTETPSQAPFIVVRNAPQS
jgi:anti-sigma-K factor RskA